MKTAAATAKALFEWLDIPINETTLKFHRDDPKTRKTCPGKKVKKDWFISLMAASSDTLVPVTPLFSAPSEESPIIDYVVQKKGYAVSTALKLLKVKNGVTTFNGAWIESARYDSKLQLTVAQVSELESDIAKYK
jgi:hypothetical protein